MSVNTHKEVVDRYKPAIQALRELVTDLDSLQESIVAHDWLSTEEVSSLSERRADVFDKLADLQSSFLAYRMALIDAKILARE